MDYRSPRPPASPGLGAGPTSFASPRSSVSSPAASTLAATIKPVFVPADPPAPKPLLDARTVGLNRTVIELSGAPWEIRWTRYVAADGEVSKASAGSDPAWLHDTATADPFERALESTIIAGGGGGGELGVGGRVASVRARRNPNAAPIERELWVFELDRAERSAVDTTGLVRASSGTIAYANVVKRLDDEQSSIRSCSALDQTPTTPADPSAVAALSVAVRDAVIGHLVGRSDVLACGDGVVFMPSDRKDVMARGVWCGFEVSCTRAGLAVDHVVRSLGVHVLGEVPRTSADVVLAPLGLAATIERPLPIEAHTSTTRLRQAFGCSEDASLVVCRLSNSDVDVVWPLERCLVFDEERTEGQTDRQRGEIGPSISAIATQTGAYIDALHRERDRERERDRVDKAAAKAATTPGPEPIAQPAYPTPDEPPLRADAGPSSVSVVAAPAPPPAAPAVKPTSSKATAAIDWDTDIWGGGGRSAFDDQADLFGGGFDMGGLTEHDFDFLDQPAPAMTPAPPLDLFAEPPLPVLAANPFSPSFGAPATPGFGLTPLGTVNASTASPFPTATPADTGLTDAPIGSPSAATFVRPPSPNSFGPVEWADQHSASDRRYAFGGRDSKFACEWLPTPASSDDEERARPPKRRRMTLAALGPSPLRPPLRAVKPRASQLASFRKSSWRRSFAGRREYDAPTPEAMVDLGSSSSEEDGEDEQRALASARRRSSASAVLLGPGLGRLHADVATVLTEAMAAEPSRALGPLPTEQGAKRTELTKRRSMLQQSTLASDMLASDVHLRDCLRSTPSSGASSIRSGPTDSLVSTTSLAHVARQLGAQLLIPSSLSYRPPPPLRLARHGAVMRFESSVLRFWDKLDLEPLGGAKDITALVIVRADEAELPTLKTAATDWLNGFSRAYECNAGPPVDNVFEAPASSPLKSARMAEIRSFMHDLAGSGETLLVFVIMPDASIETLMANVLYLKTVVTPPSSTHVAPVFSTLSPAALGPRVREADLKRLAVTSYDRLLTLVHRRIKPSAEPTSTDEAAFLMRSFIIEPRTPSKVEINFNWPEPPLDLTMRHRFLHVAYAPSSDGRWLVVCSTDDRGEGDKTSPAFVGTAVADVVRSVWAATRTIAEAASVEWRISVVKVGLLDTAELEAWQTVLDAELPERPVHVTVSSIDPTPTLALVQLSSGGAIEAGTGRKLVKPLLLDIASSVFTTVLPEPMSVRSSAVSAVRRRRAASTPAATLHSLASALISTVPRPPSAPRHALVHVLLCRSSAASTYTATLATHTADLVASMADLVHLDRLRSGDDEASALPLHVARASFVARHPELLELPSA